MFIMFILMLLPLIAIPVFWYLPLVQAIPLYLICFLLSVWMFWLMRRNKRYRIVTGRKGLIGQEAEVVSKSTTGGKAEYTMHVEGELWNARSSDRLQPGEKTTIIGVEGNRLLVEAQDRNKTDKTE